MDRNLALEFVRITESAALSCSRYMGRGDEKKADQAAVDAMRQAFDDVEIKGTVVIGEGERDEAPMLYIGEEVGMKTERAPEVDIALDPLEGTTICAQGGVGAIAVIAVAEKGGFLHAPDTYMEKIAVGPKSKGVVDLDKSVEENIEAVSKAVNKPVKNMTVVILNRPRHEDLIARVRKMGARIQLIGDGDVSAAIAAATPGTGIDMFIGTGGAPEGVISAAALQCMGGDFQGRLQFRNDEERVRAKEMGIKNLDGVFTIDDLAKGSVMFCATGVTDGPLLRGVRFEAGRATTQSVVMRSKSGTIRWMDSDHDISKKPKIFTGNINGEL